MQEIQKQAEEAGQQGFGYPAVVGNSSLLGFGVDTGAAAVTIANQPES